MTNELITVYQYVQKLSKVFTLYSTETKSQVVSGSELRRWITKQSVEINGVADKDPNEVIDYPVFSVVIHPKSKRLRNTLIWNY